MYKNTDIELKGKTQKMLSTLITKKSCPFFVSHAYHHYCLQLLVVSFNCPEEVSFTVHWYLKYYPCHNEFNNIEVSTEA